MKIEIDLPEIEGFEYTGEYRIPVKGEWGHRKHTDGAFKFGEVGLCADRWHILRKLKPKREFKDGAFYPVKWNGQQGVVVCFYSYSKEPMFSLMNGCNAVQEDLFTWIGEELNIKEEDWYE